MRISYLAVSALSLLALGACTKPEDSAPAAAAAAATAAPSPDASDSTSLSIDTDKGAVSFEQQDGADKTSISIGDSEEKK